MSANNSIASREFKHKSITVEFKKLDQRLKLINKMKWL